MTLRDGHRAATSRTASTPWSPGCPSDVTAESVRLAGDPADQLGEHSAGLDLMLAGSRGYGPLRSVLVGGVSGRLMRTVQCPVIVVPRGVQAPLATLFARRGGGRGCDRVGMRRSRSVVPAPGADSIVERPVDQRQPLAHAEQAEARASAAWGSKPLPSSRTATSTSPCAVADADLARGSASRVLDRRW